MKFVEMENLKPGMRLARPIYNKKGVLLVERGSQISQQIIESVRSFGLLGMYILEPAEPLPPMSEDDMEYEKFQISTGFTIQEELDKIITGKKQIMIASLASMIIRKFGYMDGKLNFYQNLRSLDDYVSRHCLNVAILCAMISRAANMRPEEQLQTVQAALVHDLGILRIQKTQRLTKNEMVNAGDMYLQEQLAALELLNDAFPNATAMKRICSQALRAQADINRMGKIDIAGKFVDGAKVLLVANRFDELTAVNFEGKAESEVKAVLDFRDHPANYDPEMVNALLKTVNVLIPGVSVVLNTGAKALVLAENPDDILRPTVLSFTDNSTINLALYDNRMIQIMDVMKTLDNRYIMVRPGADGAVQ